MVVADLPLLTAEVASGDEATTHFIDRLRIANDYAKGCALLAEARLSPPVAALTRNMLESLITIHWASLSESNAEEIQTAAEFESIRLMRNILRQDHAILRHKETLEDKTQQILNSPFINKAKSPRRVNIMAKESGLGKLYEMFYGIMSLLGHGTDTRALLEQPSDLLSAAVEAARTLLEAIYLIVVNRVRNHRPTTVTEIETILHMIWVR